MENMKDIGKWETIECENSPTGRHENGFVECNGKFYLMGGRGIKPVEEFDPTTMTWKSLSPTPLEIHHFQPVVIDNTVYIVGAMTGKYPRETPLENIYLYYPQEDRWTKGPVIPQARRRGSSGTVVYQGKIYLVCGIIDGHHSRTINWFDCYDPATDTWEELVDAPHIRDHFPGIVIDDTLYVIGGRNTSVHTENEYTAFFGATIREVDCYDFHQQTWRTLDEKLPIGTAAGGIGVLHNYIFYIGGESGQEKAHDEIQCFNLIQRKWEQLAPLQRGRHGTQVVMYNEALYITAGSGNRGGGPELTSLERFSYNH
jgi:N-acetylneuraminic acid mutarotase